MHKLVILDRDGTINADSDDYIKSADEWQPLPGALEAVQHITSNDASKLQVGQIQYSGLTTPEGTFVDDLLVYRFGPSHYLLVINAGNIDKDVPWITARASESAASIARR